MQPGMYGGAGQVKGWVAERGVHIVGKDFANTINWEIKRKMCNLWGVDGVNMPTVPPKHRKMLPTGHS